MIGLRIGPSVAPRIGAAIGISADPIAAGGSNPMAGVTRDATSGLYFPATPAEWITTLAAASISSGSPSLTWNLQEASGSLTDAYGSFPGSIVGTVTYQSAISGQTRKGIATADGTAGIIENLAVGLPDLSTTSVLGLVCVYSAAAPSTNRTILQLGPTFSTRASMEWPGTAVHMAVAAGNTANGATNPTGGLRLIAIRSNKTAGTVVGFNNADKITPTFSAPAGKGFILGGDNSQTWLPGTDIYSYAAMFSGAAAEMSDAALKRLYRALGYTVAWT